MEKTPSGIPPWHWPVGHGHSVIFRWQRVCWSLAEPIPGCQPSPPARATDDSHSSGYSRPSSLTWAEPQIAAQNSGERRCHCQGLPATRSSCLAGLQSLQGECCSWKKHCLASPTHLKRCHSHIKMLCSPDCLSYPCSPDAELYTPMDRQCL